MLLKIAGEIGLSTETRLDLERVQQVRKRVRQSVKDAIFTDLFSRPAHLIKAALGTASKGKEVGVKDLRLVTLENVMANGLKNDPGFAVRDTLVILIETQSTWSPNIVLRRLRYLMDSWERWLDATQQTVFSSSPVRIPIPELYAVFQGMEGPDKISLADTCFGGHRKALSCSVRCIYKTSRRNILGQYIRCTVICNEEVERWGTQDSRSSSPDPPPVMEENVLSDYMKQLGKKLIHMLEIRSESEIQKQLSTVMKAESVAEGTAEEKLEIVRSALRDGLTHDQIARITKTSLSAVQEEARKLS